MQSDGREAIRLALQASSGKVTSIEKKTVQRVRHQFNHLLALQSVFNSTHS